MNLLRSLSLAIAGLAITMAAWAEQDTSSALVQLNGDPLATFIKTKPEQGKKINFDAAKVKAYRAQLSALRNNYKQWLHANVPQAQVTGNFDISLNAVAVQLNGATLEQISAAPMVKSAQYQGLYAPNVADPDMALINAPAAWAQDGGPANAGDGVRIAIVDTGIDITHPCFSDAGYPSQQQLGNHSFTNNKVIVAKVFNNKTPSRVYTAEPLQEHGTHVAGTAACNYGTPANVDGVATYNMSGVAPRALLGNYNIFPADVTNARSEDILDALEAAYADGFDVANLSLGGGSHGIQDLLTVAIDNFDAANMVVAVAAGNSGPGLFTVESPGSGKSSLTAGAASVGHLVANSVTAGGSSYPAQQGEFGAVTSDLTAPFVVLLGGGTNGLDTACTTIATNLTGKIALITRGACSFSTKIRNARDAGAAGVIVSNSVAGDPIIMAQDGTPDQPANVPAYSVAIEDGASLANSGAVSATIGAALQYFVTTHNDIMGSFSSQGPTDVDFRVKPDVVAPGVSVLSSIPHQFCDSPPCFAFFQGTSMATPHLSGSAAFLRGMNPTWSAADIRSAIVNTAARGVLRQSANASLLEKNVNIVGSGREDLSAAASASALLSPVSVSFGAVASGGGQTLNADVTIRNAGSGAATWALSISGTADPSVSYSVSPASVTLAAGASTTVTVTMIAAKGAAAGGHQAALEVGSAAHAVLYTLIK
jgi:minor extracellular serine protease Vpr